MSAEIDQTKSLAELTGVDWGPAPEGVSTSVRTRHEWHRLPLHELPDAALLRFVQSGIDLAITIPLAIDRLQKDRELFGLLNAVLKEDEFPWEANPSLVNHLRNCVFGSLDELDEWDGSEEIASTAMSNRSAVCEAWAMFELRLSKVPR
jgi:hypothetical protein